MKKRQFKSFTLFYFLYILYDNNTQGNSKNMTPFEQITELAEKFKNAENVFLQIGEKVEILPTKKAIIKYVKAKQPKSISTIEPITEPYETLDLSELK